MISAQLERYRSLVERAPVGIMELDAGLHCVYVNDRWCEITGLAREDALTDNWGAAIHPEEIDAIVRELTRAAKADDGFRIEHRLVHHDGRACWVLVVGHALRDDGEVSGYLAIVTDVTAERQADARLRALVEHSSDVILIIDANATIVYASPAMERSFGWEPESLVGTNGLDIVHPDDREASVGALVRLTSGGHGTQTTARYRVLHRDGSWIAVEAVATNLLEDDAIQGIVLDARDVSERVRADERLAESEERYRRIVETADEGVWMIDAANLTTFVNQRMAEILGYEVEELVGTHLLDYMDGEDRAMTEAALERRREGSSDHREMRLRHRDGHNVWVRVSAAPHMNAEGEYEGAIALVTDITEHREIEEALRYNEARLTALFEASSDIMAVLESDGGWHASPAGTRILGYPMGYDPEGGLLSLVHPDDLGVAADAIQEVLDGRRGGHEPVRLRVRHLDGHYRWFDCVAQDRSDDDTVRGIVIIARDVTDQKAAEDAQAEAEMRFRAAFERSPLGISIVGLGGKLVEVNPAFCRITGRAKEELVGTDSLALVHPDDRDRIFTELAQRTQEGGGRPPEAVRLIHAKGHTVWVLADASLVPHADGSPDYAIALMADVTERKLLEERLEYQAFHDPLTQLPNRARLRNTLEAAWSRRDEHGRLALLFVDLDRFKNVNDTLGHDAGDELLLLVARRLERSVRLGDSVARFGGDEFVVVCEHVAGRDEAVQIAGRIRESLARTYRLSAGAAEVAASVGVALDDAHATVDDLLRDADIAAYRAKDLGRNRVEVAGPTVAS